MSELGVSQKDEADLRQFLLPPSPGLLRPDGTVAELAELGPEALDTSQLGSANINQMPPTPNPPTQNMPSTPMPMTPMPMTPMPATPGMPQTPMPSTPMPSMSLQPNPNILSASISATPGLPNTSISGVTLNSSQIPPLQATLSSIHIPQLQPDQVCFQNNKNILGLCLFIYF